MITAILNLQSSKVNTYEEKEKYRNFVDTTPPRVRLLKALKRDWTWFKKLLSNDKRQLLKSELWWEKPNIVPYQCDVLIVGGGAIGSSVAYWLRKMVYRKEFNVCVIEKDPMVRSTYIYTFLEF